MVGQSIENYRIEELLGQGGMGSVYRAIDTSLDRSVALKIMNPGVATNADFLRRFKSEARVLGRLQHPNIVNVYTFRHVDSHLIIVMEYVGGGTLSDLIDQHGAIPIPKSIDLLKQSLNALDFAHSSNIIHRDIKPPNILLTEDHQVKVSDFGLAKIQEDSNATMVTRVGMTGGTLHYMPPEQTEALSNVDHRGDLYSLGMTFYQMLAGRVPFDRNSSAFSILRAIDQQKIPTPDSFNANIPKGLVDIVMKSIRKYPDDRFQSAEEMLLVIEQFESTFGVAQGAPGGFAKTQILSKPPVFGGRQQRKSNSGNQDRHAVGSRSSSKVKKQKSSSRVTKPRKLIADAPPTSRNKLIPIVGVALLVLAGIFIVPRFFSSPDSESDREDSPVTQREEVSPPVASAGENQSDIESVDPAEGDQNEQGAPSQVDTGTENESSSQPTQEETRPASPVLETRSVEIYSTPTGATVLMNGRNVGRTPLTLDKVQPEIQRFQLRLDGYETANHSIDISQERILRATLAPLSGQVRVIVRPFGDIFINGEQKASQTSRVYEDELGVGTYTVRAQHPSLGMWEKEVNITAGQQEEVLFNFAQEFSVTVVSQPTNIYPVIVVDGVPQMTSRGPMTTPRQLNLPPGNHTITVQLDGFRVTNGPMEIVLEENLQEPLSFILESQ